MQSFSQKICQVCCARDRFQYLSMQPERNCQRKRDCFGRFVFPKVRLYGNDPREDADSASCEDGSQMHNAQQRITSLSWMKLQRRALRLAVSASAEGFATSTPCKTQVIPGMSDYPYTQMPDNCMQTDSFVDPCSCFRS